MEELANENVKWRYQVMDYGTAEAPDFRIHEVYFNTISKRTIAYTENPIRLKGYESKEEIIDGLELIIEYLRKGDIEVLSLDQVNFK